MLDISLFGTLFFAVDMNGVYGNFQTGKQVLVWSLRLESETQTNIVRHCEESHLYRDDVAISNRLLHLYKRFEVKQ